jgi:hypothetical protein
MSLRALNALSDGPNYQREAFTAGLQALGAKVVANITDPRPSDILVVWNRHGAKNALAQHFERGGATVLVAENGYFGKNWLGRKWFALARGHHAGAGQWNDGGPQRWDAWSVELAPWRDGGREILILEQRGIGAPGVASPEGWADAAQARYGGRIRRHPGVSAPAAPLDEDLRDAQCVLTWHSAGALQALLLGVPVFYDFPHWIGAGAARPLAQFGDGPAHGDRLAMFRRLAWAMWTADEVRSGQAFQHLLTR